MNPPNSPFKSLSPEWRDALRVNQMGGIRDRLVRHEKTESQGCDESASFIHSAELLTLIALLKSERIRRGLSLGEVARATDQARSALSRLENGRYPNPTFNTIYRYASALEMRIEMTAKPLADELNTGSKQPPCSES